MQRQCIPFPYNPLKHFILRKITLQNIHYLCVGNRAIHLTYLKLERIIRIIRKAANGFPIYGVIDGRAITEFIGNRRSLYQRNFSRTVRL